MALLNAGADVNEACPLCEAVERNNVPSVKTRLVKALIERGANPDPDFVRTPYGYGHLINIAAERGPVEVVKLLIEKGVDPNKESTYFDMTVNSLYFAASGGQVDAAKYLLEKGVDADVAMAALESFPNDKYLGPRNRSGHALLKRLLDSRAAAQAAAASKGVSKEDIRNIVQAAVDGATKAQKPEARAAVKSDIDHPVFEASQKLAGDDDIAVIIGIEGYQDLPKSDFSYDDAKLVKEYSKALGYKERNIELLLDERATKSSIEKTLEAWLPNKVKDDSRVFVYYSGHGAPDPQSGEAYLVPYDGDPNYLATTGYSLKRLYANLGRLPVKEVIVALDSCFSGSGGRSVLAKGARPLVTVRDAGSVAPNMVVIAATQGAQISSSSLEKGHGIFTYYFLKALKDGKKDIPEIYDYIKPLVEDDAKQLNVQQSPSLNPPPEKIAGRFLLRN